MAPSRFLFCLTPLFAALALCSPSGLFGWEPAGDRVIGELILERLPDAWREKIRTNPELADRFFDGIAFSSEAGPLESVREKIGEPYFGAFVANGVTSAVQLDDGAPRCVVFQNLVEALRRGDERRALFFFGVLTRSIISETACDNDPVLRFVKYDSPAPECRSLSRLLDPSILSADVDALGAVKARCDALDLSEKEFLNANAMNVRLFLLQWSGRDAAPFARALLDAALAVSRKSPDASRRYAEVWAEILAPPVAESLKAWNAAERIAPTDERAVWYYLHGLYELEINARNERPTANDVFAAPFVQAPETPLAEYRVVYDPIGRKTDGLFGADDKVRALAVAETLRESGRSAALYDARAIFRGELDPESMKLLIFPASELRDYYWLSAGELLAKTRAYAESGGKILWLGPLPESLANSANVLSVSSAEILPTAVFDAQNGAVRIALDEKSAESLAVALETLGANEAFVPGQIAPPEPVKNSWDGRTALDFGF